MYESRLSEDSLQKQDCRCFGRRQRQKIEYNARLQCLAESAVSMGTLNLKVRYLLPRSYR